MTLHTILNTIFQITQELESAPTKDNPAIVMDYLCLLSVHKASINKLIPEAQYLYDTKLGEVTEGILTEFNDKIKGNANLIKNLIANRMKDENRVMMFLERASSTIERQSNNYVTVLSYLKQEVNKL